jgi:hypothetical protein
MMRITTLVGICLSAGLVTGGPVSAQPDTAPPASPRLRVPRQGAVLPPRDTSATPQAPGPAIGTATLAGRVVASDSGHPLGRATVTAMPTRPADGRGDGGFSSPRRYSARTDDEGRFTIRAVPAGEYLLTARRAGYVDQGYGQVTPTTPPRPITVGHGTTIGPLAFQLMRGGVITGRVLDETGEPAERVRVRTVRAQRAGAQTRFITMGEGDLTDDLGHYRLFGLPPGEYLVMAEPNDRRAFFMGSPNVQGVEVDTIPTYGPGTSTPADAQKVQVQPGVDAAMDIQLVAAKVATIRGRVTTSRGEPLQGGMVRVGPAGVVYPGLNRSAPIRGDGEFAITGVPPGTYTIVAQSMLRGGPEGPDEDALLPEMAMQTITVEGEDLVVPLGTTPGSSARGRVRIDGGDPSLLEGRTLRILAFSYTPGANIGVPGRGRIAPDRTFQVAGLRGSQVFSVEGLPEGWWLKDVRVGGQSAIDGFDFGSGRALAGVEIVLSGAPTGLAGTVAMPTGAAADDYAVVLFPEDEARWEQGSPGLSSPARVVRPGLDGAFTMRAVRPGSYYVVALPAAQADYQVLMDPDQLRMLAGRARTVEVREGVLAPVTLTLVER